MNLIFFFFEKILISIQSSKEYKGNTIKEAICIANIIKLNNIIFGFSEKNREKILRYTNRIIFIIENQKDKTSFKNEQWYSEFIKSHEKIKDYDCNRENDEDYNKLFNEIKSKNENIFDEIDKEFNRSKEVIYFIEFILKNHPK